MSNCNNDLDFSEGEINLKKFRVGGSYAVWFDFSGDDVDITNDDFTLTVYDSTNTQVGPALGIGSGLTIVSATELQALFGSPITDEAGNYSYVLEWSEIATGANAPVVEGNISVRP